jgi:hypothetical protein
MMNMKRSMVNRKRFAAHRPAAIGLIVVCIVGTAILIAARTPEPTAAAASVKAQPAVVPVAAPPAASITTTVVDAKIASTPQSAEAAKGAEPVTIEGCLVQDNDTYRLKNTSGEDAPKGRSWKSGFLHRGSKTLDVVDARHRLNLAGHAGQRVSVTGMLDDKELEGRSIKHVAGTCN